MCYSLIEPIIQNANFVCLRYAKNGSSRSFLFPCNHTKVSFCKRAHLSAIRGIPRKADLVPSLVGGVSWVSHGLPHGSRQTLGFRGARCLATARKGAHPPYLCSRISLLWVLHGFCGGALGFPAFRRGSASPLRGATASIAPRVNCENQPLTYNIKKHNLSILHNYHL